jgi:predicted RNase H-like nuclease (RuvC/YqgF family)
MPHAESNYYNNWMNSSSTGLWNNNYWKNKYLELYHHYVFLQHQIQKLNDQVNEYSQLHNLAVDNNSYFNSNNTSDSSVNKDAILSQLQNKNMDLTKTVMNKTKEINLLKEQLQKYHSVQQS